MADPRDRGLSQKYLDAQAERFQQATEAQSFDVIQRNFRRMAPDPGEDLDPLPEPWEVVIIDFFPNGAWRVKGTGRFVMNRETLVQWRKLIRLTEHLKVRDFDWYELPEFQEARGDVLYADRKEDRE